jgi:exonuclease SbcD
LTAKRAGLPSVVYSGSMERIDFGEEGDAKGFCWVELQRGEATYEFVTLPARPFVTLEMDLRASESPTAEVVEYINAHTLHEAVVRLILRLTPEVEAKLNEGIVRDALRRAGVSFVAAIRKEVDEPVRARLGDNPEGLTDLELLDRYFAGKGADEARRELLRGHAERVIAGTEATSNE